MKINNITDFFHFARNNGFANSHPEISAFVRCMEECSRMCPCDPQASRVAKVNLCKGIYINFVSHKAVEFKNLFMTKVPDNALEFYNDGRHLLTLPR